MLSSRDQHHRDPRLLAHLAIYITIASNYLPEPENPMQTSRNISNRTGMQAEAQVEWALSTHVATYHDNKSSQ